MAQRGPKPKAEQFKRAIFSMRMRPEMRASLEAAAAASGKSITDEIHDRLAQSFAKEDRTLAEFGGSQPHAIIRLIMENFWLAGAQAYFQKHLQVAKPQDWLNDPYAYDEAVKCAAGILEGFRPSGEIAPPNLSLTGNPIVDQGRANLGAGLAEGALFGILQAETDLPLSIADADIRKRIAYELGPLLRRRIGQPIEKQSTRGTKKGAKS